jgi:alcohol dehydrogenase (cytochrome c)
LLRWHFQFTPHDLHGWDSTQVPVLVDDKATGNGKSLAWPNRNGFFYSIDAKDGKFRHGVSYARQTWAEGLGPEGRPLRKPDTAPSSAGTLVWPSVDGATIWWPPAFNPALNLIYVPVLERPGLFFSGERPAVKPGAYALGSTYQEVTGEPFHTAIRALDASTGRQVWEMRSPDRTAETEVGGLLATAGELVFGSDQGVLQALDARTGALLWKFDSGAKMLGPPVTYSVNGEQVVVVAAGRLLLAFALAP